MPTNDPKTAARKARIYETRRLRLRELLDRYDTMTAFAHALGESVAYLGRMVKMQQRGRKNIGEDKARAIEEKLGLARGWLDQEKGAKPLPPPVLRPAWPFSARLPREIWDNLTPAEQRKAEGMLLTIISGIEAERTAQKDVG